MVCRLGTTADSRCLSIFCLLFTGARSAVWVYGSVMLPSLLFFSFSLSTSVSAFVLLWRAFPFTFSPCSSFGQTGSSLWVSMGALTLTGSSSMLVTFRFLSSKLWRDILLPFRSRGVRTTFVLPPIFFVLSSCVTFLSKSAISPYYVRGFQWTSSSLFPMTGSFLTDSFVTSSGSSSSVTNLSHFIVVMSRFNLMGLVSANLGLGRGLPWSRYTGKSFRPTFFPGVY